MLLDSKVWNGGGGVLLHFVVQVRYVKDLLVIRPSKGEQNVLSLVRRLMLQSNLHHTFLSTRRGLFTVRHRISTS